MVETTEETWAADGTEREIGLDDTVSGGARPPADVGAGPEVLGRYVILGRLGAGAMGVVHAAYDPELDRRVALKLVLADGSNGTDASQGRARLLREAQALAKLSHPNVVTIHDVGAVGEQVWIAMELVRGRTLTKWCAQADGERRSWREVIEVMTAAGAGLRAAHEAGLLHRDFKPDNVMVGEDGRVRVMDFGLARTRKDDAAQTEEIHDSVDPESPLALEMTRAGAIVGTPAYMAPELLHGEDASAASDQFSFCVTLWEALFGERPFAGGSLIELLSAVVEGRIRDPQRRHGVPRWLEQTCRRGLATDPSGRWPSMDALLAALRRGRARSRWRRGIVAVGVVGLGLAGVSVEQRYELAQREEACTSAGMAIDELWNEEASRHVRAGLEATGLAYASETADKVLPRIDARAQAWREARTEVCLDATVRETLNDVAYDRATWCLDERHAQIAALVEQLERADKTVAQRATSAAAALRSVQPCRDHDLLARLGDPPQHDREQVRALREDLSRAEVAAWSGKYEEGLSIARPALARALELGWPPLVALAHLRVGDLEDRTAEYEAATSSLEDAYFEASRAGAPEVAAAAASRLVFVIGDHRADAKGAQLWVRITRLELDRKGAGVDDPVRADLLKSLSSVRHAAGDLEGATEPAEQALEIWERTLGPEDPNVATGLISLGEIQHASGAYKEAVESFGRALSIYENALGPGHPDVASALDNLASATLARGEHARAVELYERALEIREQALGPDHDHVATTLNNLAITYDTAGDLPRAKKLYARALGTWERSIGPEHPQVGMCLFNIAALELSAGELGPSREHLDRALAIFEKGPETANLGVAYTLSGQLAEREGNAEAFESDTRRAAEILERVLGPDHPFLASALDSLARQHREKGEREQARALYQRALDIYTKTNGPDHADRAFPLLGLAKLALAQAHAAEAVEAAEEAVRVRQGEGIAPDLVAEASFDLARALWAEGADPVRALELANDSARTYADADPSHAKERAEVEAWIESHRPKPR
jgi:tetratricopeptide (TPR) repeat protein